ncbi:MAG: hypothetical protein OXP66_16085 [Candidatus Tectomicrobia bacterium]|nr:hypothetical protein [Candidatus Tectomicrobia bacterium]
MMNVSCRPASTGLEAFLIILGMVLLLAGCGGGSSTSSMEPEPMDNGGGPLTDLGEWNTPMAGALDVSDTNQILRAHYDDSGDGRVVAAAPVQPQGTGTAVWNGMWSGEIEVAPDQLVTTALALLDSSAEKLAGLAGAARVTAYFGSGGVMADLTYLDLDLDEFGISELTSERVAVTGGRFAPTKTESADTSVDFQGDSLTVTVSGEFAGKGAFAGAGAAGVVGYMGGDITVEFRQVTRDLGTFRSVFYGTIEGH